MEQNFVEFLSPGSFVAETTTKAIEGWDVETAREMSKAITERYGAKPYGFRFLTRARADDELDSRVVKRSGVYYLHAKIETLAEIEARNDPQDRILIANMRSNGYDRVVVNAEGYGWTQPLGEGDVVLSTPPSTPTAKETP